MRASRATPIGIKSSSASSECLCRLLTGRNIVPRRVSMVHVRTRGTAEYARFLGTEVECGADHDEIVFPEGSADLPLVEAAPRLNRIIVKVAEDTLEARRCNVSALRVSVENAITPLLPHGSARVEIIAKKLGLSERTLARRLAEEGTSFREVLQQLRASLGFRYLEDETMPISKIDWHLGFEEPSSFSPLPSVDRQVAARDEVRTPCGSWLS